MDGAELWGQVTGSRHREIRGIRVDIVYFRC